MAVIPSQTSEVIKAKVSLSGSWEINLSPAKGFELDYYHLVKLKALL